MLCGRSLLITYNKANNKDKLLSVREMYAKCIGAMSGYWLYLTHIALYIYDFQNATDNELKHLSIHSDGRKLSVIYLFNLEPLICLQTEKYCFLSGKGFFHYRQ